MKTAVLLALLPVASAFMAPMPKGASRGRSLKMAFENEAGVTAPLGYWVSRRPTTRSRPREALHSCRSHPKRLAPLCLQDPLGLSADGDQEKFNKYRANEIKHGRSKSQPEQRSDRAGRRPRLGGPGVL
jgi:hypothetical protein